jgi:hypothetical protein
VRHQRAGGDDLMALGGKKVEEGLADFCACHGMNGNDAEAGILREAPH